MIEVSGVAHLVTPLPFLLLLLLCPCVLREELLLLHDGIGHINHTEPCLHGAQAVVGVVVEDEEVFVREADAPYHLAPYQRSLEHHSLYVNRPLDIGGQPSLMHRGKSAGGVYPAALVDKHLASLYAARTKDANGRLRGGSLLPESDFQQF